MKPHYVFCIAEAPQYFQALTLARGFKEARCSLILLGDEVSEKYKDLFPWQNIYYFSFPGSFSEVVIHSFEIKKIGKNLGRIDCFFYSNYSNAFMNGLISVLECENITLLEDGQSTLFLKEMYELPFFKKSLIFLFALLTKINCHPKININAYTRYDLEISNFYPIIKKIIKREESIDLARRIFPEKNRYILFIGSDFVRCKWMNDYIYQKLVSVVRDEFGLDEKIVYYPHRYETVEEIGRLDLPNLQIRSNEGPVEEEILQWEDLPSKIVTFGSAAGPSLAQGLGVMLAEYLPGSSLLSNRVAEDRFSLLRASSFYSVKRKIVELKDDNLSIITQDI